MSRRKNEEKKKHFFFFEAKNVFIWLKQTFILTPILCYLNSKCYITIKTDVFDYIIDKILSQLTLHNLSR